MSLKLSKYTDSFDKLSNFEPSIVGGKAYGLIKLRDQGLWIPKSHFINTSAHEYYLTHHRVPEEVIKDIELIRDELGGRVALRSSANCEDGDNHSMAGVFLTEFIGPNDNIAEAIERIYIQSHGKEVQDYLLLYRRSVKDIRMGIIVQEVIEPDLSGVIYTHINKDQILVQYVEGFGAKLVDGLVTGSSFLYNKDGLIVDSSGFQIRLLPNHLSDLLFKVIGKIQRITPEISLDIEFAIKNGEVLILQARRLTIDMEKIDLRQSPLESLEKVKEKLRKWAKKEKAEMGTRTAVFSDSNYSELLPKPTNMDIGIYQYISGGRDGVYGATQLGRMEMGYLVGMEAIGIIHYLGCRTYFSLARNAAIYHIGFPETKEEYFKTLVNEYLTKVENDPSLGAYPQMGLYLQDPTIEDLRSRFGERAEEYFEVYLKFVEKMKVLAAEFLSEFKDKLKPEILAHVESEKRKIISDLTVEQLAERALFLLEHIRTKSYVSFVKAARLGFYYSQRLREELGDEIYSKLNQGLDGSEITESNIAIANAPTEEDAIEIAKERIGHFSSGEMLEIRHKPLRDDKRKLLAYVSGIRKTGTYADDFNRQRNERHQVQKQVLSRYQGKKRDEIAEIISSSQTYMALRESVKYLFTKEYLLIRDVLELIEKKTKINEGDIYYLYPRELSEFVSSPLKMMHIIRARRRYFENSEHFDFPSVICEKDIDSLDLKNNETRDFTEVYGKFLADGDNFEGVVVNSDEFSGVDEAMHEIGENKKKGLKVILVAKQMNLSYDPLIVQADGLVIENAGLVAHGSQRARELGKGALGGIKSSMVKTGMKLLFDVKNRKLVKKEI